jgi:hypothetical protein
VTMTGNNAISSSGKYRSRAIADSAVAFSISHHRNNLLQRGMGLEHLQELLIRLARLILRQGASLAFGGHWKDTEDNFMFPILRLISAEQEDNSLGGPDSNLRIGKLYNHSAWPSYLDVTPSIEAQWINCCRIVRITQQIAGISEANLVDDDDVKEANPKVRFNGAVTISAMRRLMMDQMQIQIPDVPRPEIVPPVVARILLGGKLDDFSGFLPGIFEEALVTVQSDRPTYILGGFGGAAETLAKAMLSGSPDRPRELTLEYHTTHTPAVRELGESCKKFELPSGAASTETLLDKVYEFVLEARADLAGTLHTGLSHDETKELLETRNIADVVRLVRNGLVMTSKLVPNLPA